MKSFRAKISKGTKIAMYPKNTPNVRIVHVGNDLWRRQEHGGNSGSKTYDPWHHMSPPMTRTEAEAELHRFNR